MCVLLVKLLQGPYWFHNFLPALNNFIPVPNNFLSVLLVTQGFLLIFSHWSRSGGGPEQAMGSHQGRTNTALYLEMPASLEFVGSLGVLMLP